MKNINGNDILVKIINYIKKNNNIFIKNSDINVKNNFNSLIKWNEGSNNNYYSISFSEYNQISQIDPYTSGQISVANAIRTLRCTGAKPIGIIINNFYSKNLDCLDRLILLKEGQSIAAKTLNINIYSNLLFKQCVCI